MLLKKIPKKNGKKNPPKKNWTPEKVLLPIEKKRASNQTATPLNQRKKPQTFPPDDFFKLGGVWYSSSSRVWALFFGTTKHTTG